MSIDLRLGDWRDVLADIDADALICDPPYSERTHKGSDGAVDRDNDRACRQTIRYKAWTAQDVSEFVASWSPRVRSWMACLTDDILVPAWRRSFRDAGRYDFAPVPIVQHKPRLSGDGPASACVYLIVARPRQKRFAQWGSLPGWYKSTPERVSGVQGAKPLSLMRELVRDYSRPGDLVCDPCAGSGTTLLAAASLGRRAVGAEMDPSTCGLAQRRINAGYTPELFHAQPSPVQIDLDGDAA